MTHKFNKKTIEIQEKYENISPSEASIEYIKTKEEIKRLKFNLEQKEELLLRLITLSEQIKTLENELAPLRKEFNTLIRERKKQAKQKDKENLNEKQ